MQFRGGQGVGGAVPPLETTPLSGKMDCVTDVMEFSAR